MFSKSLIVFGLLAAFSVQGMEATQLDTRTVELRGLFDLINQVNQLIDTLNGILSGPLAHAQEILTGFIDTINSIKEKLLNWGLGVISDALTKGVAYIDCKIEKAAALGIDIANCTAGKHEQLEYLATCRSGKLTTCVSEPVTAAIEEANEDLVTLAVITKNIINLPVELTKCLASFWPISCLTNMVTSLSQLVLDLPVQIEEMTKDVPTVVDSLNGTLRNCTCQITGRFISNVDATIHNVGRCVGLLIP